MRRKGFTVQQMRERWERGQFVESLGSRARAGPMTERFFLPIAPRLR
jgi:hypothetical protein